MDATPISDTRRMKPQPQPSQSVVARFAGVARSTVSMALQGNSRISAKTRNRILKIAEEVNYHSHLNLDARRMAARQVGRTIPLNTLGFIWRASPQDNAYKSFTMALLKGMMEGCHETNQCLLMVNLPEQRRLMDRSLLQCDGLIPLELTPEFLQVASKCGKPIVTIQSGIQGIADVGINNQAAVEIAFRHLYERGHRKIGWLGPTLHSPIPSLRWAAYCECLKQAGLPYNAHYVRSETDASIEDQGMVSLRKLWEQEDRPTAFVVYNDMMALGVLQAAKEMEVRVPGELSLVSIDDIPEASLSQPPLTTVAIGTEQLGKRAILLLEEFVRTGTYRAEHLALNAFVLKERGTVASIPHR